MAAADWSATTLLREMLFQLKSLRIRLSLIYSSFFFASHFPNASALINYWKEGFEQSAIFFLKENTRDFLKFFFLSFKRHQFF